MDAAIVEECVDAGRAKGGEGGEGGKEDELAVLCRSRQAPSSGTRYESEKELTFEPPVSNNDFYHYLKGINYLTLLSEPIIDCQGYHLCNRYSHGPN